MTKAKLIDDCFTVIESKLGTWHSFDGNGKEIITALTEEKCIAATRWDMKCLQEGFPEEAGAYESFVEGKL